MSNDTVVLAIFQNENRHIAAADLKESGVAQGDAIWRACLNESGQLKTEKVGKRSAKGAATARSPPWSRRRTRRWTCGRRAAGIAAPQESGTRQGRSRAVGQRTRRRQSSCRRASSALRRRLHGRQARLNGWYSGDPRGLCEGRRGSHAGRNDSADRIRPGLSACQRVQADSSGECRARSACLARQDDDVVARAPASRRRGPRGAG